MPDQVLAGAENEGACIALVSSVGDFRFGSGVAGHKHQPSRRVHRQAVV